MIISENRKAALDKAEVLLKETVSFLEIDAKNDIEKYRKSCGTKLENLICDALRYKAKGSEFEDSIELVSGHKFPDIIISKRLGFGVEVKSTVQDHWQTLGNSVLETTRIGEMERIFLMFGKLSNDVAFRVRPYEACLADVLVTHSPRYKIDMELKKGETIFEKIGQSYDVVRQQESPIKTFVDYYKSQLKPGETLWWAGESDMEAVPLKIRELTTLPQDVKKYLRVSSFILFPETLSSGGNKYNRVIFWLLNVHGVISASLRDLYTAGGRATFMLGGVRHSELPQVIRKVLNMRDEILSVLHEISLLDLSRYWECDVNLYDNRVEMWLEQIRKRAGLHPSICSLLEDAFLKMISIREIDE